MYYQRPFWRDLGFSGNCLIQSDDRDLPIEAFDDTKPDGSCAAIVGFVVADRGRTVDLTEDERRDKICKCYAKVFGSDEALKVT